VWRFAHNIDFCYKALANDISTNEELGTLAEGPDKRDNIKASRIPIISVPTSLSAGEYSNFAGGTNDQTHPELSVKTPDSIWLSTGIRAVDHCVETLCSTTGYPESDKLAEKALGMLVPGLLRCKHDHNDHGARLDCQLGSVDAMAACTSGKVELGASHGIGHQVIIP
jgi:alcohol dehydrogenase class IV